MGNCVFKGFGAEAEAEEEIVKVVNTSGGIMEFYAPITASVITDENPGHAIFRSLDLLVAAQPLLHNEELKPNELYHLLPLNPCYTTPIKTPKLYHQNSGLSTPYRMSSCADGYQRKKSDPDREAFPRYSTSNDKIASGGGGGGVWKVNLVISREELSEILSQGARIEELVDSARTVAKCGSTGGSSVTGSEQWSTLSSRWKETS